MDIGCSSGFFLKLLKNRMPQANIVGSDYVRGPLEALAVSMPDIPLVQFDLLNCRLPAASFDALVLLNVFEHIENDVAAAKEVFRLLKPGGVAVIEVPAGPHLYDVYDRMLMHHRRYDMLALLLMLQSAGFEIIERSPWFSSLSGILPCKEEKSAVVNCRRGSAKCCHSKKYQPIEE